MDVWFQEIQKNLTKLPRLLLVSFELKSEKKPIPFDEVRFYKKLRFRFKILQKF